ncbi:MAG: IS66 family insertion sequence element accessory protein TnpB [Oligoflexia bacterium]|nr:IS66 family insertion sequence element accessory protein TnpB [Oligoflexia bacterium]
MTIQLTSQTKIFICLEPLDFRNGFNGTAAACRLSMDKNPLEGGIFVFINHYKTMIRLYLFDGHGELMITKRVAEGRFKWWRPEEIPSEVIVEHIQLLLRGGDPKSVNFPDPWKRIT